MAASIPSELQDAAFPAAGSPTALDDSQALHWSAAKRAAFRFCFVYFTLFGLSNQILSGLFPTPSVYDVPDPSALWPMRQITFWTARHVFHVMGPLVYTGSGSGDKTFDWVLDFWILLLAIAATGIWSAVDRRRGNYRTLYKWFYLAVRFALASELLSYGFYKILPLQMSAPTLSRLVEPFGNFSPMAVLWNSVGSSRVYEAAAGCAEVLGGILLIVPRTATLGAIVALADTTYVFTLNMTYDVPVKLLSLHLVLLSLFLLLPRMGDLAAVLFTDGAVAARPRAALFKTTRASRIALRAQLGFGAYLVAMYAFVSIQDWRTDFDGRRTKSALYGIWDVQEMAIDGVERPPLTTDPLRWRRVICQYARNTTFQQMDDSLSTYESSIDAAASTFTFIPGEDETVKDVFTYQHPAPNQLEIHGKMNGHTIDAKLVLFDRSKFLLANRGFHWINEYPFQR